MQMEAKKNQQLNNLLKHKVLGDNVLILPMDFTEDDTVVNPQQYEDKTEWGLVVGVGDQVSNLIVGDAVVFGAYASTTIRSHGQDFFMVREEDITSKYAVEGS